MRRVSGPIAALLVVAIGACSRPSPPIVGGTDAASDKVAASADRPVAAAPPADAARSRLLRITSFDCEKHPPLPGQPESHGLVKPELGIRGWRGGGPDGSNWNVDDLRCAASIATTCQNGKVFVTARMGRGVILEREIALNGAASIETEFVVPDTTWRRHLDDPSRRGRKWPFKTAIFRLLAEVTCKGPVEATAGEWRFAELSADDSFVAGFASGE